MRDRRTVAILGATGHVGRVLAAGLAGRYALILYARRPDAARGFADSLPEAPEIEVALLADLLERPHDAVVNCIGIGDPAGAIADPGAVYAVTAFADEVLLSYLKAYPETIAVNISSGAAYLNGFAQPVDADTRCSLAPGRLHAVDHYGIAKMASEARHRALAEKAIIDLRLFSLFSRYAALDARFLMSDVVRALRRDTVLETSPDDIERDYVAPRDLCALVVACVESEHLNASFDIYSRAPVRKFELLEFLTARFGLKYRVTGGPSGGKQAYYSLDRSAASLGYSPTQTSLEAIEGELSALLNRPTTCEGLGSPQ